MNRTTPNTEDNLWLRMINSTVERTSREIVVNKTLKNTYMLLAMTLLFSGLTAGVSMTMNLPHPGMIVTLVGYFGLLFLTSKFSNSGLGIVLCIPADGIYGLDPRTRYQCLCAVIW